MIPSCSLLASAAGSGAVTITLSNFGVFSQVVLGTATATYTVQADGAVWDGDDSGFHFVENWISDPAQAADYEIKAVLASGSTPTGTLGSYQALSADREWSLSNALQNNSVKSCVLTLTIRKIGTTTVLATAQITLDAESDNSL